jgi:hypothetical protein
VCTVDIGECVCVWKLHVSGRDTNFEQLNVMHVGVNMEKCVVCPEEGFRGE